MKCLDFEVIVLSGLFCFSRFISIRIFLLSLVVANSLVLEPENLDLNPSPNLLTFVTLGKSLNLGGPQFLYLLRSGVGLDEGPKVLQDLYFMDGTMKCF